MIHSPLSCLLLSSLPPKHFISHFLRERYSTFPTISFKLSRILQEFITLKPSKFYHFNIFTLSLLVHCNVLSLSGYNFTNIHRSDCLFSCSQLKFFLDRCKHSSQMVQRYSITFSFTPTSINC